MGNLLLFKGIGPVKEKALEQAGILSLRDLIYYTPYRYEDRTIFHQFSDLEIGKKAHLKGEIIDINLNSYGKTRLVLRIAIEGGSIEVVYFAAISFWQRRLKLGQRVRLWGKVQYYGSYQIVHPNLEFLTKTENPVGDVLPIYHLTQSMIQSKIEHRFLQKIIVQVLNKHSFEETLSQDLRNHLGLFEEKQMLLNAHSPETIDQVIEAQSQLFTRHWFPICLDLEQQRHNRSKIGQSIPISIKYKPQVIRELPFELTLDQERAVTQIEEGLVKKEQYYGLLNGDVGCGKTIVALLSALSVIEDKKQVVLMAPTEILAQQHFHSFQDFLKNTDIQCCLLTGQLKKIEREEVEKNISTGQVQCIIGTQAVLFKKVHYYDLAYVILDEQQRYGVEQRRTLVEKGKNPAVLQMTATPIPQALVQIFYEDMDHIIIRQKPDFQKQRKTSLVPFKRRKNLFEFLQVKSQNQEPFFWVLPRIEHSENGENLIPLPTVERVFQEMKDFDPHWKIAPFHSKIPPTEQQQILKDIQENRLQGLIATTVIEVGINLPSVNLMVIEAPERFGLSQLHQLRGRIGRGTSISWCFLLLSENQTEEQQKRLLHFTTLNKGFEIAELDLELRGPGELQGNGQSGFQNFKAISMKEQMQNIWNLRNKIQIWVKN